MVMDPRNSLEYTQALFEPSFRIIRALIQALCPLGKHSKSLDRCICAHPNDFLLGVIFCFNRFIRLVYLNRPILRPILLLIGSLLFYALAIGPSFCVFLLEPEKRSITAAFQYPTVSQTFPVTTAHPRSTSQSPPTPECCYDYHLPVHLRE